MKCQKCGHEPTQEEDSALYACPACGFFYPLSEADTIRRNLEKIKHDQATPVTHQHKPSAPPHRFSLDDLNIPQAIFVTLAISLVVGIWQQKPAVRPHDPGIEEDLRQERLATAWKQDWRGNVIMWLAVHRTPNGGLVEIDNCLEPVLAAEDTRVVNCTYLTNNAFGGKTKQRGAFYFDQAGLVTRYSHLWP